MFSSMFPQDLNRHFRFFLGMTFTFQPFKLLHCFISVSLCFGPPVYNKWSLVYPTLVKHWQTSKGINESMIILSDLELPALPYVAPITAISGCQNIHYFMCTKLSGGLVGRWFVNSQKYMRDHWVMQKETLWLHAIILYSSIEH